MLLTIAEYAAANSDGTYTVLRGGIISWHSPRLAVGMAVYVLVDVPPNNLAGGRTRFQLVVRSASGVELENVVGEIDVIEPELSVRFAIQVAVKVHEYGPVSFAVDVAELSAEAVVELKAEPLARQRVE
jgi:hypothetical protein